MFEVPLDVHVLCLRADKNGAKATSSNVIKRGDVFVRETLPDDYVSLQYLV